MPVQEHGVRFSTHANNAFYSSQIAFNNGFRIDHRTDQLQGRSRLDGRFDQDLLINPLLFQLLDYMVGWMGMSLKCIQSLISLNQTQSSIPLWSICLRPLPNMGLLWEKPYFRSFLDKSLLLEDSGTQGQRLW